MGYKQAKVYERVQIATICLMEVRIVAVPFQCQHQMSDMTQEILKVSRLSPGFRENFSFTSNTFSTVYSPLISTYLAAR